MASTQQLSSATRVCRTWNAAIPSGVEKLELDMSPCRHAWDQKVDQLQRLTPSLSRCKAHVSTAVPKGSFGANIRKLGAQLKNIQVGGFVGWSRLRWLGWLVVATWTSSCSC